MLIWSKSFENWWCPFTHEKKEGYSNAKNRSVVSGISTRKSQPSWIRKIEITLFGMMLPTNNFEAKGERRKTQ